MNTPILKRPPPPKPSRTAWRPCNPLRVQPSQWFQAPFWSRVEEGQPEPRQSQGLAFGRFRRLRRLNRRFNAWSRSKAADSTINLRYAPNSPAFSPQRV